LDPSAAVGYRKMLLESVYSSEGYLVTC